MQICKYASKECAHLPIGKCADKKELANKIHLQICIFSYCLIFFARALGFEPRSRVLETRMLAVAPCPQKRSFCKSLKRRTLKASIF
jgi:hypothetical protein